MIIEFVGVPGAGKSTLALEVREILRELGQIAMLRIEAGLTCFKRTLLGKVICLTTPHAWHRRILWAVFRRLLFLYEIKFAIVNRKLTRHVLGLLGNREICRNDKRKLLAHFFRVASYHEFFSRHLRSDEVLILSEGLVHRITSLYSFPFSEPDPFKIRSYIESSPRVDLLICVSASLENCLQRIVSRGGHTRYSGKDLESYLAKSNRAIRIAMQRVEDFGWPVVRVHNNGWSGESVADFRAILSMKYGTSQKQNRLAARSEVV